MAKKSRETEKAFIHCVAQKLIDRGQERLMVDREQDGSPNLTVGLDRDWLDEDCFESNHVFVTPDDDDPAFISVGIRLRIKLDINDPESIDDAVKLIEMAEAFNLKKD